MSDLEDNKLNVNFNKRNFRQFRSHATYNFEI